MVSKQSLESLVRKIDEDEDKHGILCNTVHHKIL